jgi:S1-C subfamily serine protease
MDKPLHSLISWSLLVFCVGVILLVAGCVPKQLNVKGVPRVRADDQYTYAVAIYTTCITKEGQIEMSGGSGVVVGPRHVITAAHVVDCDGVVSLKIESRDERKFSVLVNEVDKALDLALLELSDPKERLAHSSVPRVTRPPRAGEMVCTMAMIPDISRRCGLVQWNRKEPPGDMAFDTLTVPGNSGGGVYDRFGNLVGIITHYVTLGNGQIAGGRATSLWQRKDLIP